MRVPTIRFYSCFVAVCSFVSLNAAVSWSQPFDELHCYEVHDSALHEAAVSLLERDGEIPATCTLKSRAVRACVPVRSNELGQERPAEAADGSLLFDRLCYKVVCPASAPSAGTPETAAVVDRFGEHEFALGETKTLCTPAALGDLDEFLYRGDPEAAEQARKRTGDFSRDVDLTTCGDFNGDGAVTATDALAILRAAVGSSECLICVCDVDMSGAFTATDALAALQNAVGVLAQLNCQQDGSPVTWDGGGDNVSWSDPLNWSLDTRIPNLCDDVMITTGLVTTVEQDAGDNGALRILSGFPLDIDGGSLELRDTIQVNNVFRFTGGKLVNATILPSTVTGDGPVFTSSGGTLDNVIVNAPMNMSMGSARTNVENGLTLNDTATLGSSAQLIFSGQTQALEGTGEVVFASTSQGFVNAAANTDLTIGSEITIRGKAGRVGSNTTSVVLTNNGTIHSDEPGRIDIRGGTGGWTNAGTLQASSGGDLRLLDTWTNNSAISITGGGVLTLDGDWSNAGTIESTDSVVELDGAFTLSDLGTFNRTGGTVKLLGTLDNVTDLALDMTTGSWEMRGGRINGGAVTSADGAELIFTSSSGTLDTVTFDAPMNMSMGSARTNVENGLTLNDTATLGSSAQLIFSGQTQALEGTGEVVFASTSQGFVNAAANTDLTIGSEITIRGKAGRVGSNTTSVVLTNNGTIHSDEPGRIDIRGGTGGWTNAGTLQASSGGDLRLLDTWTNNSAISITGGGVLTLDGDWSNAGTIESTDSVVELDGAFTLSDLGTFNRTGGTVKLLGTLDNVTDLALDMTTGSWEMRGGRINGGAVTSADGAELIFTSSSGTLDTVTFDAPMNMSMGSARTNVENGLTLNDTATLGSSAQLIFSGQTQALEGTGEVVFASTSQGFVNAAANTDLTIGSEITIRGKAGRVGSNTTSVVLTNNGTIHSDEPGRIDIRGGTGGWTNAGTLQASSGGDLRLLDTWTNNSAISITGGGVLTLDGDWSNAGTIESTDSVVELDGAFTLSDLGTFNRTGGTVKLLGTLDNVTDLALDMTTGSWEMRGGRINGGAVTSADGAELIFTSSSGTLDTVTFDAPMNMSMGSARTNVENGLTLNDTATLGSSAQLIFSGQTQALEGTGEVVFASTSQGFVNAAANTDLTIGSEITIRGKAGRVGSNTTSVVLTNNGTIHSDEPGRIDIRGGTGGWTNAGTLQASSGGDLRTLDTWTNNGSIVVGETGTFTALTGLPLTGAGDLTVDIGSSTDFGVVEVTGAATLAGTLNINRTNGFMPTAGESFVIMTYDSVSGSFSGVTGTSIGGGLEFAVNVGATDITLTVVAN